METIDQYTIYCTAEQTEKALKLGAPIIVTSNHSDVANKEYYEVYHYESRTTTAIVLPTAEQMIGFIIESGKGYSADLSELIREQGYKQGCLTFIDRCLK